MTPTDKNHLRNLRDNLADEEEKKLLRKTINYINTLESRLATARTLLRTAMNETDPKRNADSE